MSIFYGWKIISDYKIDFSLILHNLDAMDGEAMSLYVMSLESIKLLTDI